MNNKLTILGVFYDGYEDLWIDFVNLINKNWPDNPFELVIANQTYCSSASPYKNVTFINAGSDAEFSKKIQLAIKEIKTEYVLVLLEDFFVSKKILTDSILKIIDFIQTNKIVYYTMPIPSFITTKEKKLFNKVEGVYRLSGKKEYVLNCQPAIWKKDFLSLCVGNYNYNAWIFEGVYSKKDFIRTQPILENCVADYRNPLHILHGAVQGKIVRKTKSQLKKEGYDLTTNRQCLSVGQTIRISFKNLLSRLVYLFHLNWLKRRLNKKSVLSKYDIEIEKVSSDILLDSKFIEYKKRLG